MKHPKITIFPGTVNGYINAPPSKSVSQRAAAAALLKGGVSHITNFGKSNDELVALNILKQTGCEIGLNNNIVSIKVPEEFAAIVHIHMGESGLSCRMFAIILATLFKKVVINADTSLQNRPMNELMDILLQMNATIEHSTDNYFPFSIENAHLAPSYKINGSLSSQYLTGLLMATGGYRVHEKISIEVENLVSKPYVDLTLQVLHDFELNVPKQIGYERFEFEKGVQNAGTVHYCVEGDWSNAAFLLVAGAISGKLKLTGVDLFSKQGDKAILNALMDAGARLSITTERVSIQSNNQLKAFQFDATNCPDLFPPLVALATCCHGTTVISGVHRLIYKESDRAATLIAAFKQLSIDIHIQDDLMIIHGGRIIPKGVITAPNDHRIVMAIAVASISASAPVSIINWQAVNKSYPSFFDDLVQLGIQIQMNESAI